MSLWTAWPVLPADWACAHRPLYRAAYDGGLGKLPARPVLGKVIVEGGDLGGVLALEAAEAVFDVYRVGDLALLAVVHHVHDRIVLLGHRFRHRRTHAGVYHRLRYGLSLLSPIH